MILPAVIFDMDGVLVDSHPHNLVAINTVLKEYGLELAMVPDPHNQQWKGGAFKDLVTAIRQTHHIKLDVTEFARKVDKIQLKSMSSDSNLLHEDLLAVLNELNEREVKIALCSSSLKQRILKMLDLLRIRNYFDVIVGAEDVEQHKPAPHCYLLAAQLLGAAPKECIAVEDSLAGVLAAKEAGMKVIGFSQHTNDDILLPHIDFHARHYSDLRIGLYGKIINER